MNANLRNFALWVIIVLLLLALFTLFQNPGQRASSQDISFSQLLSEVDQGKVRDVVIQGPEIHGTFTNGSSFQTYAPSDLSLTGSATVETLPASSNGVGGHDLEYLGNGAGSTATLSRPAGSRSGRRA